MSTSNAIVVGVDGTAPTERIIQYAATMAERWGGDLHLVHVVPKAARTGGLYAIVPDYYESGGARILRDAVHIAEQVIDPSRVHAQLEHGRRVPTLLHAAENARAVVLGFDSRSTMERLATGSTVAGVGARCTAQLIVVPVNAAPRDEQNSVVVGVKDISDAGNLLHGAFALAGERQGRLRIIHASRVPTGYEGLVGPPEQNAILAHINEELRVIASTVAADHPGIEYDVEVVPGQGARVLATASESADLLVIERRRHPLLLGHLGATAHALLRESRCPMVVMPPVEVSEPSVPASAEAATASPQ